jgi:hypothetical protein
MVAALWVLLAGGAIALCALLIYLFMTRPGKP